MSFNVVADPIIDESGVRRSCEIDDNNVALKIIKSGSGLGTVAAGNGDPSGLPGDLRVPESDLPLHPS